MRRKLDLGFFLCCIFISLMGRSRNESPKKIPLDPSLSKQSSTLPNRFHMYSAPEAIYGSCNFTFSHTTVKKEMRPSWTIDMKNRYNVTSVIIGTRTDFTINMRDYKRFKDAYLMVSDKPYDLKNRHIISYCDYFKGPVTPGQVVKMNCNTVGRYLTISLNTTTILTMCKLKAFGYKSVDGGYSKWSKWSMCSTQCGIGTMSRSRQCNNPFPRHGGRPCIGLISETKDCKEVKNCTVPTQTPEIIKIPNHSCTKAVDCVNIFKRCSTVRVKLSSSSEFRPTATFSLGSNINVTNIMIRTKHVDYGEQFVHAYFVVTEKPFDLKSKYNLHWCNFYRGPHVCKDTINITCGQVGQYLTIVLNTTTSFAVCDMKIYGYKDYTKSYTPWSDWTACDCGQQKRTRVCIDQSDPKDECRKHLIDSRFCHSTKCIKTEKPKKETSKWSAWSPWSKCSKTCDSGVKKRTRKCLKVDKSVTKPVCPGKPTFTAHCSIKPCKKAKVESCDEEVVKKA